VVRHRILIILNPAAGRRRSAERHLRRFIAALERRGCRVVLRRAGSRLGDAERLAREAKADFDAIVAAGGDGTLNAVVNGLTGSPTPIGVLPLGTTNVLAREIGLPRRPESLAGIIVSAPARPIWAGSIAGRAFLVMASTGFDSEIVASVNDTLKRRIGRFAFAWAFLVQLCRYLPCELSVRADGVEHRAAALIASKGRYYAGPFVVAPEAKLSEPTLELVLFRQTGRLAILRYALGLFLGVLPRLRDVTIVRAREVVVIGDRSLPAQGDGDIIGYLPVTIGIGPDPLFLISP
jgi:diacylglycerol kinase (ATP)